LVKKYPLPGGRSGWYYRLASSVDIFTQTRALHAATQGKLRSWEEEARAADFEFVPAAFETNGRLGNGCVRLLRMLADRLVSDHPEKHQSTVLDK
jgi:hypothetical protein